MRFVVYAALVLNGKPSSAVRQGVLRTVRAAERVSERLGYAGTRSYIQRTDLLDTDETQLIAVLERVETPK